MSQEIKEAGETYAQYVRASREERLHLGPTLERAAILLMKDKMHEIERSLYNSEEIDRKVDRNYLMEKIASDLLTHVEHMGHTKQYDLSPKLKDYTYLAFDLMYEAVSKRPNRKLIPALAHRLYYLMHETDKNSFEEGKILFRECVAQESAFLDKIMTSDRPWYSVQQ